MEQTVLEGWLALGMWMVVWAIIVSVYAIVAWKLYKSDDEIRDLLFDWTLWGGIVCFILTLITMGGIYTPIIKIVLGGRYQ